MKVPRDNGVKTTMRVALLYPSRESRLQITTRRFFLIHELRIPAANGARLAVGLAAAKAKHSTKAADNLEF